MDLWSVDTSGGIFEMSVVGIHVLLGVVLWEVDNFLEDLDVRFVDGFGGWDPLGVDFVLENVSGWGNSLVEVGDIILDVISEVLISLGSSSVVVGNLHWVLELDVSWSGGGSWGEFGFGNLVVPGSGVHVLDSLTSGFPVLDISFECISGTVGVLQVCFKILFGLISESISLVHVIIHLTSDQFSFSLLSISNHSDVRWVHVSSVCWSILSLIKFNNSLFVSLEFLWPLSLSGGFESSFLGSDRVIGVNEVFLKFLSGFNIVGLGSSPFIKNSFLVINGERPFSLVVSEVNILHFVVESFSILLVDNLLLLNVGLNLRFESFLLCNGVVVEVNDVIDDGFV